MSLTKATFSMVNGAPFNVLDYGAVGDGSTDDTTAIQAAITAACAAKGKLVFPRKNYVISSVLTVTAPISIDGEMSQILQSTTNTDVFLFDEGTAGSGNYQNTFDVRNLNVRTVAGTGNGFVFRNINESTFENLFVTGCGNIAFYVQGCLLSSFKHCYTGNGLAASPAFFAAGASACQTGFKTETYNSLGANTNTFVRCTATNATVKGFDITGTGNTFINCDCEGNTSPAVGFDLQGLATTIIGGNIEGTGVSIDVNATNCTIQNVNALNFVSIESGIYGTTVIGGNIKYLNFIAGSNQNTAIGVRIGTGGSLIQNGTNNNVIGCYNFNTGTVVDNKYKTTGNAFFTSGTGTPEGVLVAPIGSLYTRIDGGASTTLYIKESGTSNTGWVAK